MAIDLSGGLDPRFEYFQAGRPANPEMRDSSTLWIMDASGTLAFPRVTFDAIGSRWERPWVQLNLALADGRALRVWSEEPGHSALGPDGKASIRGAGPLRFECVDPFRRWVMEFDGTALQSTTVAQMAGDRDGTPVPLSFRFEAEMAAPPWLMGGLTAEAAQKMNSGDASALMGGVRYEQLCRVNGMACIAGKEHSIAGTGMRVRRQGVRRMGAATGHCQHSALFPSGRAFGAIAFAPAPDGSQSFNEGFVFTGDGSLVPARIVTAPWMARLVASGADASLVLESGLGTIRIEGTTMLSTFDHHLFEMADSSILSSSAARYVWDGEETIGLIERCTLREAID
jgi:hypothetical protein